MLNQSDVAAAGREGQVDYLLVILTAVIMLAIFYFVYRWVVRIFRNRATWAKRQAKMIAGQKWQVVECRYAFNNPDRHLSGLVLSIRSSHFGKRCTILFRPAHPDIPDIEVLEHNDIIRFKYVPGLMEYALKREVCNYLRLAGLQGASEA